jgi:hypothetical protein
MFMRRKRAEHAGKITAHVPSFSACSAFSAEQLQPLLKTGHQQLAIHNKRVWRNYALHNIKTQNNIGFADFRYLKSYFSMASPGMLKPPLNESVRIRVTQPKV